MTGLEVVLAGTTVAALVGWGQEWLFRRVADADHERAYRAYEAAAAQLDARGTTQEVLR